MSLVPARPFAPLEIASPRRGPSVRFRMTPETPVTNAGAGGEAAPEEAGRKNPALPGSPGPERNAAGQPVSARIVAFALLRFAPWAVAAALVVAALWFAKQNVILRDENATLRTERQLAEVACKMVQNQLGERSLLAESMINSLGRKLRQAEDLARLRVTALASPAGSTKEAQGIVVWDPEQQAGLLIMEKLTAIADTQDYQIWVVDPAYPNPVNGGIFHVTTDGKVALAFKPDQPIRQAAAFAISLEKKGGVPKAEGPIVLLGK